MQDLHSYFETTSGTGILATSNSEGEVDVAIYARPHFMENDQIAFIMRERLSHQNLQTNPHAAYLFIEKQEGYQGKRLYLTKTKEETNPEIIKQIRRRENNNCPAENEIHQYLVYFAIDRVRPLIGDIL